MANTYLHLDDISTLSDYNNKFNEWKHKIYELFDEMRIYHQSLEIDQKWYGLSHEEFFEENIKLIYEKFLQPAAQFMDEESCKQLRDLQIKAEELGTR